ncbi:hypothetical protein ACFX13_009827 [Malus domestica]
MGSYTDVALVQEEVVVPPTFGSSLQTPNVLEIAKINPLHVPERYLLKNQCRRARIICVSFLRRFLPLISLCFQVGTRRSLPNYAWLAKNGASSRWEIMEWQQYLTYWLFLFTHLYIESSNIGQSQRRNSRMQLRHILVKLKKLERSS